MEYARETLQQMKITDLNLLPPEHVTEEMSKAVSEQRTYFRFHHRLASNEIREVEVYSTPFVLHGDNFLYSIGHDVTELTRTAEALLRAQQTYEELVNSLESIVWECDAHNLQFSFVSKQAERFLGYPWPAGLPNPILAGSPVCRRSRLGCRIIPRRAMQRRNMPLSIAW
jgi:PAS domain-containing protein